MVNFSGWVTEMSFVPQPHPIAITFIHTLYLNSNITSLILQMLFQRAVITGINNLLNHHIFTKFII